MKEKYIAKAASEDAVCVICEEALDSLGEEQYNVNRISETAGEYSLLVFKGGYRIKRHMMMPKK